MAHDENLFYFAPDADSTIFGFKEFENLVDKLFME